MLAKSHCAEKEDANATTRVCIGKLVRNTLCCVKNVQGRNKLSIMDIETFDSGSFYEGETL